MKPEFHVIVDNLRSLYNVGSIFRTADALGISKIWLVGITGTPEQAGVQKVALGAEKSVPWKHVASGWQLAEKLKRQGFMVVSLELTNQSVDVKVLKSKFPLALIVGNEVNGVSESLLKRSDSIVQIQMQGIKESLNVSVAFGIAAWEITRTLKQ